MPCEYELDLARRLVRLRAWGVVTYAEMTATRLGFSSEPVFTSDFSQLYDFRDVTRISVTGDEIRETAAYSHFSSGSRRAFVAPHNVVYGLARMFAIYREVSGGREQICVFRNLADAEAWLGLADSSIAAI